MLDTLEYSAYKSAQHELVQYAEEMALYARMPQEYNARCAKMIDLQTKLIDAKKKCVARPPIALNVVNDILPVVNNEQPKKRKRALPIINLVEMEDDANKMPPPQKKAEPAKKEKKTTVVADTKKKRALPVIVEKEDEVPVEDKRDIEIANMSLGDVWELVERTRVFTLAPASDASLCADCLQKKHGDRVCAEAKAVSVMAERFLELLHASGGEIIPTLVERTAADYAMGMYYELHAILVKTGEAVDGDVYCLLCETIFDNGKPTLSLKAHMNAGNCALATVARQMLRTLAGIDQTFTDDKMTESRRQKMAKRIKDAKDSMDMPPPPFPLPPPPSQKKATPAKKEKKSTVVAAPSPPPPKKRKIRLVAKPPPPPPPPKAAAGKREYVARKSVAMMKKIKESDNNDNMPTGGKIPADYFDQQYAKKNHVQVQFEEELLLAVSKMNVHALPVFITLRKLGINRVRVDKNCRVFYTNAKGIDGLYPASEFVRIKCEEKFDDDEIDDEILCMALKRVQIIMPEVPPPVLPNDDDDMIVVAEGIAARKKRPSIFADLVDDDDDDDVVFSPAIDDKFGTMFEKMERVCTSMQELGSEIASLRNAFVGKRSRGLFEEDEQIDDFSSRLER